MLDATLWQVDMGDGTWAVCCMTCQRPLYRGPKPIADLIFDTHGCEPVIPPHHPHPDRREAPMKLRLTGTEAECSRLTYLLRYGPPDLEVTEVSPPYPNRGDSTQVRVYLEVRFHDGLPPLECVFYSLRDQDGNPLLLDAWGNPVEVGT